MSFHSLLRRSMAALFVTCLAASPSFAQTPIQTQRSLISDLTKETYDGIRYYKLEDGTIIAINESTQDKLTELFQDEQEIIEHMRENKDNSSNGGRPYAHIFF